MTLTEEKAEWKKRERRKRKARSNAEEIIDSFAGDEIPVNPFALADAEHPLLTVKKGDFKNLFDGQLEYHPSKKKFLLFFEYKI